jgi:hypothetical protein
MFLGSRARPVRKTDNLMPICELCGILNISQSYRPPRPLTVTALLLLFTFLSLILETEENYRKPQNSDRKNFLFSQK